MKTQQDYSFSGFSIWGMEDGKRLESRILEERIQKNVAEGRREIEVKAFGQHGIGGRLWSAKDEIVHLRITGSPGQRTGSLGFPNTQIEIVGPVSDDVGWLNAGAEITVHGHAGNGAANAMAQGKVYVSGNIGARGMTMTKHNPRFDPPEMWILGSVGDYFAEFMAGGIAVICGHEPQDLENILGYRPCVGMVGGKIFFRGSHSGFSNADAKLIPLEQNDWEWLFSNLRVFLKRINKSELLPHISKKNEWQLIAAKSPHEKAVSPSHSMSDFRKQVWDAELGRGGLIGDLTDLDRSPIPLINSGNLRRFIPVWENRKYTPPCEASCPTGIPVHERWRLIREGRIDEAVDMALAYTPFPATICGYLCPNLCMQGCTRQTENMAPVDITKLGKASINAKMPELPSLSGKRIAVIGSGPAGISIAWQLRKMGHEAVIYDKQKTPGGKLLSVIPESRIPKEVISTELKRIQKVIPHIQQELSKKDINQLITEFDFLVIAAGAQKPRIIPIPGKERLISALDFLTQCKKGSIKVGKRLVIIGAGNVGCDVATEAHRFGAEDILLIDVQEPASFGKERKDAEKIGAKFRWPCFTNKIIKEGVVLKSGELIPADTVVISIGDMPDLDFLPESIELERGFIKVNEYFQTTDPKIFAIGDAVRPGLLTDAIGSGRKAANAINEILLKKQPKVHKTQIFDYSRVHLEYFDPRIVKFDDEKQCAEECASCGSCRDCGLCVTICPQNAISRQEKDDKIGFEMVSNPDLCIGCGFCANACPCGIWQIVENDPIG
ncbi:Pyridine nucleotide-disulfide oxidoreductase [Candidatus Magnetomoraceae bacterium gMMP-15]